MLEALARDFEPDALHGRASLEVARELGVIQALLDGLKARVAKRVDDTCAYMAVHDSDAKYTVARAFGVEPSEAQRVIDTAGRLEQLPAVDAAVRAGVLSARATQLIAAAAAHNPAATDELIATARDGLDPLKDACIAARSAVEDPQARAKRQHRQRSFRMWTDTDGMIVGRFAVTPEVGGQIKAIVDKGVQHIFRARRAGEEHEPHEAYAADVFTNAFLQPTELPAAKVTTHVVMDHSVLALGDALPGATCEIPASGP